MKINVLPNFTYDRLKAVDKDAAEYTLCGKIEQLITEHLGKAIIPENIPGSEETLVRRINLKVNAFLVKTIEEKWNKLHLFVTDTLFYPVGLFSTNGDLYDLKDPLCEIPELKPYEKTILSTAEIIIKNEITIFNLAG